MSRLIACGCSFTYGHGLRDCRYDGINYTDMTQIQTPSHLAWPQIAANKLGIECVNLSRCGESNRYIAYALTQFEFQPDDIVVPMWTHFTRRSLIQENGVSVPLGNWQVCTDQNIESMEDSPKRAATAYYKYMHNPVDAGFENLIYINFVNLFIRNKNLQLVHACTRRGSEFREAITSEVVYQTPWNQVYADLIFDDHFELGQADDGHPNEESHQSFGARLAKFIKNHA